MLACLNIYIKFAVQKFSNDFLTFVKLHQRNIGVDVYGDCGTLQCGNPRNMGHKYRQIFL